MNDLQFLGSMQQFCVGWLHLYRIPDQLNTLCHAVFWGSYLQLRKAGLALQLPTLLLDEEVEIIPGTKPPTDHDAEAGVKA